MNLDFSVEGFNPIKKNNLDYDPDFILFIFSVFHKRQHEKQA
jgi:hypothetical protein